MTAELESAPRVSDLKIECQGALTDDVLTVAATIAWAETQDPIYGLEIASRFLSGNHLPAGDLKAFNVFYDESTGTYWFDVKVRPVKGPMTFVLQTTATVNGKSYPVSFKVPVAGPSPLVVSPLVFDGAILRFEVSASSGKLMRYPLDTLATCEINHAVTPATTKNLAIPYGYLTTIDNGLPATYFAVMGTAKVDEVVHTWVARVRLSTNDGEAIAEQTDDGIVHVVATLKKPNPDVSVNLPVHFDLDSGLTGLSNKIYNLTVKGEVVEFDLPVHGITKDDNITVSVCLAETNKLNAPVFLQAVAPVKLWNNNQTEIDITVASHTFNRTVEQLFLTVTWKDGTPVKKLVVRPTDETVKVQTRAGHVGLSRKVTPNPNRRDPMAIAGVIDLSAYGIPDPIPFIDTIEVGSDEYPAKLIAGAGSVNQSGVNVFVSVRQNNGEIFSDVDVHFFNGHPVKDYQYDPDKGIASFVAPSGSVEVSDGLAPVVISFAVGNTSMQPFNFKGKLKVEVPYVVGSNGPTWLYKKDDQGRLLMDVRWELSGNNGTYPDWATFNQLRLNGMDVKPVKTQYSPTTGVLIAVFNVSNIKHNQSLFIAPTVAIAGTGGFLTLPPVETRYKVPGQATYVGHEFVDAGRKVRVDFDIQGWFDTPPNEVRLSNGAWQRVTGVVYGHSYTEYDPNTGRLTVLFTVLDGAREFTGDTTMQFNMQDFTVYPITFKFSK